MAGVNNSTINLSVDDREAFIDEDSLEAYTVLLSTTVHILSMLFGGTSSISVIMAIATRRNIDRSDYALVLTLFGACCICNFIWSPMEIIDLIMFHYYREHPCGQFVSMKTGTYLFSILLISFTLASLSYEGIIRLKFMAGSLERKTVFVYYSAMALFGSAFLICVLLMKCLRGANDVTISHIITDKCTRSCSVTLIALVFFLVAAAFLILLLFFIKEVVYWKNGWPRLQPKYIELEIPMFPISQSNVSADIDGGFMNSRSVSGTLYPTTPQLLAAEDSESSSMSGEDTSHIFDVHKSKPTGNRLGINMAQVLGRRRHTICQISDISNEEADLISRAKQYNYVRKFSVDISALQAQLQNPKIFRDAPYQSDIDLSKKQSGDNSQVQTSKPLLPLKLFYGNLELEKMLGKDKIWSKGVSIFTLPPPVITVSNDDTQAINGEDNIPKVVQIYEETSIEKNKDSNTLSGPAQKLTTLNSDDKTEHMSVPAAESAVTNSSDIELEICKMVRLSVYSSVTFLLTMVLVLVTEMFNSRLSSNAFMNISTCMLAVSTIQTIVYPHLVISGDRVVHRAVRKLKARIKMAVMCCSHRDISNHTEDSSSTDKTLTTIS